MWPRPAASRRSGIRACSGGCDALQKGRRPARASVVGAGELAGVGLTRQ